MAGYSQKSLASKLGIKLGSRMYVQDPPQNYFELLEMRPNSFEDFFSESFDFIHVFVTQREHFTQTFSKCREHLKKNGALWVSWPKQSSKVITDLNENNIRDIGLENGLVDVKIAAFDDTWSALKFVFRLKDR